MTIQELIQTRFSGELNNENIYIELMVQVIAVLVVGLILWRLMVAFHRKKNASRKRKTYFDTEYSKKWRRT